MKKANELIAEYKLNFEQVSQYVEKKVKSTKNLVYWRSILATAVELLYATCHYRDGLGNFTFVGEELDVFMASEMYKYLSRTVERMSQKNIWKNAKHKYRTEYRIEIATCLYERISLIGHQCSWLSPKELKTKQKLVKDFLNQTLFLSENKKQFVHLKSNAFKRGINDAKEINLSRQMTNCNAKRIGTQN
ncbi:DUF7168 domain-containing protein [Treponema pectinovorum]|uniref:DUF7168 domain-containing protein n=1 Tax=Treponema pectinovorum TaxID=164 RepID=UPI0011CC51AE|nr:hypothetical protein [Treponema pectinovorum]